jgi:hypothetical protein
MNEHESRRQEVMRELAERFKSSSEIMQSIAKRLGDAAETHAANRRRLEQASNPLRKCIGAGPLPFSYREFVEFSSAEEFARFRDQAPVSDADLEDIDWDDLSKGLLDG